jgi:hypothetical protein
MKEIVVTSRKHGRKVILVDDQDFIIVSQYNLSVVKGRNTFYAVYRGTKTKFSLHRFLLKPSSRTIFIDHIDGNGLNNQRSNLRFCSNSQNIANGRLASNNSTGYKGVSFHKNIKRYQAHIYTDNKAAFLGSFRSAIEAARAYNKAAIEAFGQFAKLNSV